MKKIISVILVLMILLSCNLSSVSADTTNANPKFVVNSVQGEVGETVDVRISLENNPGITALQINVGYDSGDLELISIEDGGLFDDSLSHSQLTKNPLIVSWYSSSSSNETNDGCLAILKFKILDSAAESEVVITYNEDNVFDSSFNNIKFDVVNGTVKVVSDAPCYNGHTIVIDKAVASTCTKTGLTEGSHCSVCNTVLVEQKVVAAKGHTKVIDKEVAPTCTKTGLTEGSHCSVCNAVITKQEIVPVLGHNYVDGVCTICGEKSCPYTYTVLDNNTIKITKYIGDSSEVIIPSTIDGYNVSVIGDSAFRENTTVTSVVIPEGVTKIESWAFYSCTSMAKVTLPSTITSVGSNAFHTCSALKICNFTGTTDDWCGITFDSYYSNPLADGQYFYINDKLVSEIRIKDGTTEIKEYTFVGCRSISKITIPNSVKSISKYALCNLDKCDFLGTVEEWCQINFEHNTSSPTYFRADLYMNGELLTELIVPDSITAINNYAFMYCDEIKNITLGNQIKTIGDYAFNNCTGVESISINSDVISIGKCAFLNCDKVTNIKLPESVESIGEKAFHYCSGLKSITIPSSVKNIDFAAFSGTDSLEHILCIGTEEEWKSTTIGSSNTPITSAIIHFADTDGYTVAASTCTKDGYISHKCPVCSYEFEKTIHIPATGHMEVIDKGYAPTDAKPGLTDGSHCSVCNEIILKQEVIPMIVVMIGDANLDGNVNIIDATAIQKYLVQLESFSSKQLAVADANRDGKINILDATQIQKFLAQLIPEL